MEEYRRVLKFKSNYGSNEKEINITGGKYKYFSSNRSRLKAIDDFMDLQQYIYDKELCKHCVNPSTIKILEGEVGRYSSDLVCNMFSLDLHHFTYKPAIEVVNKFLSLIEKNKIPSYRIIVGRSGNVMFEAVKSCLISKATHEVDNYNKDIFSKEQTNDYYSRSDGHYDFKFRGGDTTLWPVYDPYVYDSVYKERKDKYDKERAESASYQADRYKAAQPNEPEYCTITCHNCGHTYQLQKASTLLRALANGLFASSDCSNCGKSILAEGEVRKQQERLERKKNRMRAAKILLATILIYSCILWALGGFGFLVVFFTFWIPLIAILVNLW